MKSFSRKDFMQISGWSLAGSILGMPLLNSDNKYKSTKGDLTIQEVIDLMVNAVEGEVSSNTVDTIKIGDSSVECTGVVSTFLATAEIIEKTAEMGANLIVTHEPTFYNHQDTVEWLEDDPVYQFKRKLLKDNDIVVWRHHDYWHEHEPDGILQGFVETMGWEEYHKSTRSNTGICTIPETSLKNLARNFKKKLNLKRPFIVGDPNLECTQIGLLMGSWGARSQMRKFRDDDIEVLVVGEVAEWETSEYIRDATFAGMDKGLIILGHAPSEAPGMKYLADWLQPQIPEIPVHYKQTTDAFIPV